MPKLKPWLKVTLSPPPSTFSSWQGEREENSKVRVLSSSLYLSPSQYCQLDSGIAVTTERNMRRLCEWWALLWLYIIWLISVGNWPLPTLWYKISKYGDRTKLLPYTNFYIEVFTQFRIKLLHVKILTNFWIKLLHIEVLKIFLDKTSTLTKFIKNHPTPPAPPTLKST